MMTTPEVITSFDDNIKRSKMHKKDNQVFPPNKVGDLGLSITNDIL